MEVTAGQPLQQTLDAEDEWRLTFDAGAGGTYILEIEQGGLDFVATVEAPDGTSRAYDSPLLRGVEVCTISNPRIGCFDLHVKREDRFNAVRAFQMIAVSLGSGRTGPEEH